MSHNQIVGCECIKDSLLTNTTLQKLDLSYNQLDNTSLKHLKEALSLNKTLTTLYLQYNKYDNDGLKDFI